VCVCVCVCVCVSIALDSQLTHLCVLHIIQAQQIESFVANQRGKRASIPAKAYPAVKEQLLRDLVQVLVI